MNSAHQGLASSLRSYKKYVHYVYLHPLGSWGLSSVALLRIVLIYPLVLLKVISSLLYLRQPCYRRFLPTFIWGWKWEVPWSLLMDFTYCSYASSLLIRPALEGHSSLPANHLHDKICGQALDFLGALHWRLSPLLTGEWTSLAAFPHSKAPNSTLFILSHLEAADTVNNISQSFVCSIADSHWSRTTLLWCPFMFLWIDELTTWQMLSFLFYCWEKNEAPGARTRTGHGPCSLTPEVGSAIPDPGGSSGQQLTTR